MEKLRRYGGYRASGIEYHMLHKVISQFCVIVLAKWSIVLAVKPRTKVHYGVLGPLTNSSNACHTPLSDHITCFELKLRGVVLVVV